MLLFLVFGHVALSWDGKFILWKPQLTKQSYHKVHSAARPELLIVANDLSFKLKILFPRSKINFEKCICKLTDGLTLHCLFKVEGRSSVIKTFKQLLVEEGVWGLTKGLSARIISSLPTSVLIVVGYETLKRLSLRADLIETRHWWKARGNQDHLNTDGQERFASQEIMTQTCVQSLVTAQLCSCFHMPFRSVLYDVVWSVKVWVCLEVNLGNTGVNYHTVFLFFRPISKYYAFCQNWIPI